VIERVGAIGARFRIAGELVDARAHGSGHIHDTFLAEYAAGGGSLRYVLQRINSAVFRNPEALGSNAVRITQHLRGKLEARGAPDRERRCLGVVPTRDGLPSCVDDTGEHWRAFRFIEGTRTCDTIEDAHQALEAGRAFGVFAADLVDLPGPPLAVTIPGFHDLAGRFARLQEAVRADTRGRASAAAAEIGLASRRYDDLESALAEAGCAALPERIVHNDCKLNNLLLDAQTGEGLCVIDLDTVMAGTVLCDFGELVRTGTCRSPEDERNLASMAFEPDLFAALAAGYLAGARSFLEDAEILALPLAGPALTLENAVRFLADHLSGDVYFRIHREAHNLDRARAQLRLLELMLQHSAESRQAIEAAAESGGRSG
jgi:Ser/Thr protein kinase RdoA (MazF antagonist)